MKKYYSLVTNQENREADIYIFGDITSWEWLESDVSSYTLAKELAEMKDVDKINVHINSYGGEVSEGIAIYNQLVNNKASITTYCDGFACSIASVIFMAGDERIMSDASLLMIHSPWTWMSGNAKELRKGADDLDVIEQASVAAYMNRINIEESELKELLDNETWLAAADALKKGFATAVESAGQEGILQSVKRSALNRFAEKEMSETPEIIAESIADAVVEKLMKIDERQKQTPPEPEEKKRLMQIFKGLK